MIFKCDNCGEIYDERDMYFVYGPTEDGGRIKFDFCSQTCLLDYFEGRNQDKIPSLIQPHLK